jgi:hypothetical protein
MTRARDVADTQENNGGGVAPFVAGKNKIINGDFAINQRGFTSTTTSSTYGFDRWFIGSSGGTVTYSAQTFTLGTAPVAGYEGTNFARVVTASQSAAGDFAYLQQRIENIRTFANQTVTVSFWAKASAGTPSVGVVFEQQFGTGGSGTVVTSGGTIAITTSWVRYSKTISVPSVAGKTIGTGTVALNLGLMTSVGTTISGLGYPAVGLQNATIDFWGVQVEAGNVATPFTTATGTIQGELAACQRYYWRNANSSILYTTFCYMVASSTTQGAGVLTFPVPMRIPPTTLEFSNIAFENYANSQYTLSSVIFSTPTVTTLTARIQGTISGAVAGHAGWVNGQNSTSAYLAVSAEL